MFLKVEFGSVVRFFYVFDQKRENCVQKKVLVRKLRLEKKSNFWTHNWSPIFSTKINFRKKLEFFSKFKISVSRSQYVPFKGKILIPKVCRKKHPKREKSRTIEPNSTTGFFSKSWDFFCIRVLNLLNSI